jgi:hypothetical protein
VSGKSAIVKILSGNAKSFPWNELSSHEKKWKKLKCMVLRGRSQSEKAS